MIRRDENSINIFHDKKNEAGYKRVLPGQFVIHLRSFQGGFAHSAIEGITSPAYTVFGFSEPEKHDSEYWKYVFSSKSFIRRLETVTYGIRDGRSISYEEFLTLGFVYPSKAEQTAIARYLDKLSDLITLHQRKFEKLTNVKKSMLEKMFPQNGSSYPEIRFKGFTDPWEQRKLGELVDRVVRKNTNNESTLPLTISAQYGLVDQITYFNNRVASRDVSNYYLVLNGEFAYNKSTSDGYPFGAVKRLDLYEKGVLSTLYIVFAPKKEQQIDSDYLTVFFDTDRWHKGVAERAAEGARNHGLLNISAEDFFDIDLSVPKDIVEQKQIGAFIRQLDNLITLHQRQPFLHSPPDISLIVQLTPPFYTFSWEQRKLGEIGSVSMCRRIFKEQTSETGDIPFYKIGTFGADPDAFISRELFEEYKSKYPYPQKGDILISASGSIGRTVEFAGNNEYFQDSNIVWLNHDERLSNPFLKCFYSVVKWAGIEGSTIKRLYNDNILNTVICMPSVPEQKRIGLFFENLDNLITLHQRQPFSHSTPDISLSVQLIHPFYTSSWEQRKVGDLLIERNQQAPMSDEYPLMAFIANEGVAPKGERYDRSALVTDTVNKLYKKTEKGDFIYSSNNLETGSIGLNKYGKACISPVYSIFEPTGIADSDFLGRRLVRKDFINAMVKWRQGVIYGQWRIHESDFLKIEISVPSVEEQRKIGAYLDQLDNLITLHQRQTIVYAVIRSIRKVI